MVRPLLQTNQYARAVKILCAPLDRDHFCCQNQIEHLFFFGVKCSSSTYHIFLRLTYPRLDKTPGMMTVPLYMFVRLRYAGLFLSLPMAAPHGNAADSLDGRCAFRR